MNETTMRVEIADAIRADRELLHGVEQATAYFDQLHEWVEPPAVVAWDLAPDQPARPDHRPAVVLTLRDSPEYNMFAAASDQLSRVRVGDANVRERAVLWACTRLLQNRSRLLRARTASIIGDAEGADGE